MLRQKFKKLVWVKNIFYIYRAGLWNRSDVCDISGSIKNIDQAPVSKKIQITIFITKLENFDLFVELLQKDSG